MWHGLQAALCWLACQNRLRRCKSSASGAMHTVKSQQGQGCFSRCVACRINLTGRCHCKTCMSVSPAAEPTSLTSFPPFLSTAQYACNVCGTSVAFFLSGFSYSRGGLPAAATVGACFEAVLLLGSVLYLASDAASGPALDTEGAAGTAQDTEGALRLRLASSAHLMFDQPLSETQWFGC